MSPTYPSGFPNPSPARLVSRQPLCVMPIDAEEDFDWLSPVYGTDYTTSCMRQLGDIQTIANAYKLLPTYLLTYPVLDDAVVVRNLQRLHDIGACALGLQLHTWVTPPFSEAPGISASFSGNIEPELEEQKLLSLKTKFVECFGFDPKVFRAGRYGASDVTPALLEKHGFTVDTSLAPRTSFEAEGGPDYTELDYHTFWFGRERKLLELPLCRSIVGWGGTVTAAAFKTKAGSRRQSLNLRPLLARTRAAERITLSPEGNDVAAMKRLVRGLLARGRTVFALSFHSSSLKVGLAPYTRTRADLHNFYDRVSEILAFLADEVGCHFVSVPELPALMVGSEGGSV